MEFEGERHTKKAEVLRQSAGVRYQFIHDHVGEYPVKSLCRLIGVTRSGYYEWRVRSLFHYAKGAARFLSLIRSSYAASGAVYGYRNVHPDLQEFGGPYSNPRKLTVQAHKISAQKGYEATRDVAGRTSILSPNLLEPSYSVEQPDKA